MVRITGIDMGMRNLGMCSVIIPTIDISSIPRASIDKWFTVDLGECSKKEYASYLTRFILSIPWILDSMIIILENQIGPNAVYMSGLNMVVEATIISLCFANRIISPKIYYISSTAKFKPMSIYLDVTLPYTISTSDKHTVRRRNTKRNSVYLASQMSNKFTDLKSIISRSRFVDLPEDSRYDMADAANLIWTYILKK